MNILLELLWHQNPTRNSLHTQLNVLWFGLDCNLGSWENLCWNLSHGGWSDDRRVVGEQLSCAMTLGVTGHSRWGQQQISVWWQNVFTENCRFNFSKPEAIVKRTTNANLFAEPVHFRLWCFGDKTGCLLIRLSVVQSLAPECLCMSVWMAVIWRGRQCFRKKGDSFGPDEHMPCFKTLWRVSKLYKWKSNHVSFEF